MKQKLLKTMLLLCALVVGGANSVWADTTGIINFGSGTGSLNVNDASVSGSDSQSKTWSVTTVGTTSFTPNTSYAQIGSSKKPATSITFTATIAAADVNVKAFSAKFGGFDSTAGTVTLKVGDTTVGSGSLSGTSDVTVSSTKAQTGTVVTVTVTGISKGVKAYYITYTYEAVSSGATTTTTISDAGITNTNKFVSTDAGSLAASVTYGSPAAAVPEASVTWSGDNDEVATINSSTGAVTLVGAGTVTFTASYAGVADTYKSSSDTYEMTVTNKDPDLETIWSEDFSGYSADDVPDGGTYSYACTDGSGTTKIYEAVIAGGTSPELLVGKSSGTFSATIPLLYPTYGYSGDLTLTFKSNAVDVNVKTTTDGITVDGEENEGDGLTFSSKDTHTVTFKGVTTSTENITIVFTTTTSSNVRIDDIVLEGVQAALTVVATPSISPASGAVASGTKVTITCATEGASIYYTTDGSTPTSSSTAYNPASKPTITAATTVKAIAVKDGLTDSEVASASYTIAAPCATPTFSVSEGIVDKGTSVSLSCATDGATIYYTTNGTTPTTSSSVYSSSLTINANQTIKAIAAKDGMANSEVASATYTVRDYANLPFSFDSGKGSLPTGMTQSALGTDYGSSPKLKFDNTDDNLILRINEAPGELKYDIQGNSFSGGTFKVQYSADGSSYTDLKSYTELGSKATETFTNIPATTRYLKWIYTTKSSGNVALGNFSLKGCESVTVGTAGYTTYTTTGKVTLPSGVKAYIATATGASTVTLTEVSNIPADEPIVVKADAGTYYLPVITTAADDVSGNLLEASDGSVTGDGSTIYGLGVGKDGDNEGKIGFYLVKSDVTVPAGKAYMEIGGGGTKGFTFVFDDDDDDATGINAMENGKLEIENGAVYDLSGRRVQKPTKGLYIVNGKKVLF
ncbi:MAG: chitobiase/beta-hexosaminidase C-terminal domain-containing protein [Bacteroidaceae bacterium]|nr:chitobiase/beta-hexosaminidase C-terminal domain-containing protein [Bacteroidaceae bacterium]